MKKNVGQSDRVIRIVFGILLFPLLFFSRTPYRLIGLASIPMILTGLTQRCGAYALIGANTCDLD